MNRDQKAQVVDRIAADIEQAGAVLALDYRGISVKQAAELRTALLEADASFRIVKNTLTERAADKAGAESLKELLDGPTALTFVRGDIAVAAKAVATFRRREGILDIKGGSLDGEPLSVDQIESIARLPARDVLHGQFVGVLASPLTTLVRGLASMISGLAVALRQIEEQGLVGAAPEESGAPAGNGEAAGEAPAEAPPDTVAESEAQAGAEAPADAEEPASGESEQPAAESDAEQPSEAPGDPVAEAEKSEEATPSEGGSEESEEG